MKVILKHHLLVLVPEVADEIEALAGWKQEHEGHVFISALSHGTGLPLTGLGLREEACREPVPINSRVANPQWRIISNFAHAPFTLDGRDYANVEGFWQGLKFDSEEERRHLAMLPGPDALHAGRQSGYGAQICYEGRSIIPGTWDHWLLMERACRAKFTQDAAANAALLSTGRRPLEHRMRRDSRTIPGAIMAQIWMRIRKEIAAACLPA